MYVAMYKYANEYKINTPLLATATYACGVLLTSEHGHLSFAADIKIIKVVTFLNNSLYSNQSATIA